MYISKKYPYSIDYVIIKPIWPKVDYSRIIKKCRCLIFAFKNLYTVSVKVKVICLVYL